MRLLEIPEKQITLYMPETLGECDQRQYIAMSYLISQYQAGQISYQDLQVQGVYALLNLKKSKNKLLIDDEENQLANMHMLSQLVDSFFEEGENGQKIIIQDYVHNHVPKFKVLLHNYYGPEDSFTNLTFGEYTDALRIFLDFHATGDVDLIYLLAAVLYRKKKWFYPLRKLSSSFNGDKRRTYNSNLIADRADKFKYADPGFIYGVFLMFSSFQKYITTAEIPWGGKILDLSILFDTSDTTDENIPGIGMDSILFTLAESGAFGALEDVQRANMWQIFVRMYDLRKRDLDQQAKENSNATSK